MKKLICISILSLVIFTAFKKADFIGHSIEQPELNLLIDYRDAYVGIYFCYRSTIGFSATEVPSVKKDNTTISITKAAPDSILQINANGKIYQFKLKRGKLFSYPQGGRQSGIFFAADSISLIIPVGHASS